MKKTYSTPTAGELKVSTATLLAASITAGGEEGLPGTGFGGGTTGEIDAESRQQSSFWDNWTDD